MNKEIRTDVAIIGGGVLGLNTAHELSKRGYGVALLEKKLQLANNASVGNGGLLHEGTHHLSSRPIDDSALEAAKKLKQGAEAIKNFAPEALRNTGETTYALIYNQEKAKIVTDRWNEGGLQYEPVSPREFRAANPQVNTKDVEYAAIVPERNLDNRVYYEKLVNASLAQGAVIFTGAQLVGGNEHDEKSEFTMGAEKWTLIAQKYIVTAGYNATSLYNQITGGDFSMRLQRVHSLAIPTIVENNILSIARNRADVVRRGNANYIDHNAEKEAVAELDWTVNPELQAELFDATRDLLPDAPLDKANVHLCFVPAFEESGNVTDVTVKQRGIYTFAWPGKVTSSPVVAGELAEDIDHSIRSPLPTGTIVTGADLRHRKVPQIASYPYAEKLGI